jgi:hypothetical protein
VEAYVTARFSVNVLLASFFKNESILVPPSHVIKAHAGFEPGKTDWLLCVPLCFSKLRGSFFHLPRKPVSQQVPPCKWALK